MNSVQGSGGRPARPTYIHELDDWPDFRWSEEVIMQALELVRPLAKADRRRLLQHGEGSSHRDDRKEPDEFGRCKQSH